MSHITTHASYYVEKQFSPGLYDVMNDVDSMLQYDRENDNSDLTDVHSMDSFSNLSLQCV